MSRLGSLETRFDAEFYLATTQLERGIIDPFDHYEMVGWKQGFDPNPFFSTRHYLMANTDVARAGSSPFTHFRCSGFREGRPRLPGIFDADFYLRTNPDVSAEGVDPVSHYVRRGAREGRWPSPLFDVPYYCSQLRHSSERRADPLHHYLTLGWKAGLSPHPLFDPGFYQAQLPSVAHLVPPLSHYLAIGWRLGFSPHPLFDSDYYTRNTLAMSDICPLIDYLGQRHGDSVPHYLFSDSFYKAEAGKAFKNDPQAAYRGGAPLLHYLRYGACRRVNTHPLFDAAYYAGQLAEMDGPTNGDHISKALERTPDLLRHYVEAGAPMGISPTPFFVPDFYRGQHEYELAGDPLRHYLLPEGFSCTSPHPGIDLDYYASRAHDFAPDATPAILHLLATTLPNRVSPHPSLDREYYLVANDGIRSAQLCPIEHFLRNGMREGRSPNTCFSHSYLYHSCPDISFAEKSAVEVYLMNRLHRRRRLLFAGHDASLTGAPRILLRLVEFFSQLPNVECFTVLASGGPLLDDFKKHSHVYVMSKRDRGFLDTYAHTESFLHEVTSVLSLLDDNPPSLAICNSAEAREFADIFSGRGFPILTLIHEAAVSYPPRQLQMLYSVSDLILFPSKYVMDRARVKTPVPADRVVIRPQGLLTDGFGESNRDIARMRIRKQLRLPNDALIVLGCGTVDRRKGVDLFAETARRFFDAAPEARNVFFVWIGAGTGPDRYDSAHYWVQRALIEHGLQERVLFVGQKSDPEPFFLAADAFLLTSRVDPLPCVVHEAMACALPVLAFEGASGAPELFEDSGVAVPMDAGEMAHALRDLLADGPRRAAMGRDARNIIATRGSFAAYARDIARLIEQRLGVSDLVGIDRPAGNPRGKQARSISKPVYFSASDWSLSGVNTFTEALVRGLNDRGFDARILFTRGRYSVPKDMKLFPDVPIRFIQPRNFSPAEVWHGVQGFFHGIRQPCIYVPNYDYVASAVSPLLPETVGIVGIAHSDDIEHYEHVHRLGLYWDRIVSVSRRIHQEIIGNNASLAPKCSVIRYGIPFDRLRASEAIRGRLDRIANDPIRIVYVGRFVEHQKRISDYAKLARRLIAQGIPFRLTMLGDGEQMATFRADVADLVTAGVVELPGRVSQGTVTDTLSSADVFLLLSDFEGLPLSLLEAMSVGCIPVVWEMESGIPELITHGENGFILAKGDFEGLAALLGSLQRDWHRVGALSTRVVDAFAAEGLSQERMIEQYAALLDSLYVGLRDRREPRQAPLTAYFDGVLPPPWVKDDRF